MRWDNWYTGDARYDTLMAVALIFAAFVFAVSWFFPSPYGRFASERYGVSVDPRVGWFLMELPSTLSFLYFFSREEVERGEKIYRIPTEGLFRWVSSPSYLTELVAWAGFALCTWSLAGVFIFVISAANLVPRAIATHQWYREKFSDYPKERRALIPYIW